MTLLSRRASGYIISAEQAVKLRQHNSDLALITANNHNTRNISTLAPTISPYKEEKNSDFYITKDEFVMESFTQSQSKLRRSQSIFFFRIFSKTDILL